jgi:hypothetical protein
MISGYARVSTDGQSLATKFPCRPGLTCLADCLFAPVKKRIGLGRREGGYFGVVLKMQFLPTPRKMRFF